MFHSVSWKTFFTFFFTLAGIYYLAITFFYYREEVFRILNPRPLSAAANIGRAFYSLHPDNSPINQGLDLFELFLDLIEKLNPVFSDASSRGYPKGELVMALQLLLRNYQPITGSPGLQSLINNYISGRCKKVCSTTLSDDDLNILWNG